MLEDLSSKDKVVGLKQVRRAIACGWAGHVFLARDADPQLTGPLEDCCREAGVPVAGGTPWPSWAVPAASTYPRPQRRCWQRKNRFQRNKIFCSVENIGSYPTNL